MHSLLRTFCTTSIPASFNFLIPFPATKGFGSTEPITTFLILLSIILSAQGGVFPWCEQGSKFTTNVESSIDSFALRIALMH